MTTTYCPPNPKLFERLGLKPELSKQGVDFIDEARINWLLDGAEPEPAQVRAIIQKSLAKEALDLAETATLLRCASPELVEEIFEAARELKRTVYGNRIVLFAPLYIGNLCINDCHYCGFRRSNTNAHRRTLSPEDIRNQVEKLEDEGHKRLIVVFGEHSSYGADMVAQTVDQIYQVKKGNGEIRRININAAPLDYDGFRKVQQAGIGTYQIFMETYHHETYARMHPAGTMKSDYLWRLDALSRAFEVGQDDVGLGVLFGLADWRFEVMGLVQHSLFLQQHYGCGPHTISFPRLRPAQGVELESPHTVSDYDFKRVIAILRLAVPYTGLILTAREPAELRTELMAFGVSQIDAGSRIELGGYTEAGDATQQQVEKEQFELGDIRSLDEVMTQLLKDKYLPSFCTACYRLGRTGEHFMEFAIPGFIKRYCTPNALTTLQEYLQDYGSETSRAAATKLIQEELDAMPDGQMKQEVIDRLNRIESGDERDLYF
jgi:2-iminoacetate synthase